ncbi:pyridoxamine 5'-phosphate oxidase family protein [Microbacterium sp. cf332]|uniref:pyridoxamine 5'-phosphate oxidase family protein n=1 Tax=Microbacterium sp. cf332 TaxID=1761804 RepID=UPI00088B65A2|nr:pyridoxamine 5'-phosphate oxidase family protein [Microbacterium sp. cf332]SDQ48933.1 pyridoxamine 5'-phosphate oxidase [Microbacterium sp. cf332]
MTSALGDWLRSQPSLTGSPPAFDVSALPASPAALFEAWIREAAAAGVPEPHAATLATADADGRPDARTLILKDLDDRGWAFASTRSSAKGAQLAANPAAALDFWWQPLMRAVRVRGAVSEATAADTAADLAARSAEARRGVAPGDWALWRIEADRVEFWQGAADRRHVRVVYERDGAAWRHSPLHHPEAPGDSPGMDLRVGG